MNVHSRGHIIAGVKENKFKLTTEAKYYLIFQKYIAFQKLRIASSAAGSLGSVATGVIKGGAEFYNGYSEVRAERLGNQVLAITNGDPDDDEYKELSLDETQIELSGSGFKGAVSREIENYKLDEQEFLQNYLDSTEDEEDENWLEDEKKGNTPFDWDVVPKKALFDTKRLTLSSSESDEEESFGFKKKDIQKGPSLQELLGTHPGILAQTKQDQFQNSSAAKVNVDETWDLFS